MVASGHPTVNQTTIGCRKISPPKNCAMFLLNETHWLVQLLSLATLRRDAWKSQNPPFRATATIFTNFLALARNQLDLLYASNSSLHSGSERQTQHSADWAPGDATEAVFVVFLIEHRFPPATPDLCAYSSKCPLSALSNGFCCRPLAVTRPCIQMLHSHATIRSSATRTKNGDGRTHS